MKKVDEIKMSVQSVKIEKHIGNRKITGKRAFTFEKKFPTQK